VPELVRILAEPAGPTYAAVLRFALRQNSLFSLVWRDQLQFAGSAAAIADTLRPALVRQRRTREWPGTTILGHSATLRLYRMTPSTLPTLASAERLYAWVAPERPEDLAFYVGEDAPWLASIAHEQEAFVYREAVDVRHLSAEVDGLRLARTGGR